ncbi:hypothetical protein [Hugenholtzia roseola]|uniref:hypothetical protein n=1 Tax=Hugenholtzia roseola TaxID=1002 RepID=UPI0012B59028|nr:hypothetical protein [Hugenholtzia roseola]
MNYTLQNKIYAWLWHILAAKRLSALPTPLAWRFYAEDTTFEDLHLLISTSFQKKEQKKIYLHYLCFLSTEPNSQTFVKKIVEEKVEKGSDIAKVLAIYFHFFRKNLPNKLKRNLRLRLMSLPADKIFFEGKIYNFAFSDICKILHPKFNLLTQNFIKEKLYQEKNKTSKKEKWKEIEFAHTQNLPFAVRQHQIAQAWAALLPTLSEDELCKICPYLFLHVPECIDSWVENLQEILQNTDNQRLNAPIHFEKWVEAKQNLHQAYVKRMSKLLNTSDFLEGIIQTQEQELRRLQAVSRRLLSMLENEVFFDNYYTLLFYFYELEKLEKKFFVKLTSRNFSQISQEMQGVLSQIVQLQQDLEQARSKALSRDLATQTEQIWQQAERKFLKKLKKKVAFFQEINKILYSEEGQQVNRLFYYSALQIQEVLKKIAENIEALENAILYKIRGRILAFKEIQQHYLAQAQPKVEAALSQSYDIALAVVAQLLEKLHQANILQAQALAKTERPDTENPALLGQALEENLEDKQKKQIKKGIKLENFQNLYKEQVRKSYWQKSEEAYEKRLKDIRRELTEQLSQARKAAQGMLEITQDSVGEVLQEVKQNVKVFYEQIAEEEQQLYPFFTEIRGKVRQILEKKEYDGDFLDFYPNLSKVNKLQKTIHKAIEIRVQNEKVEPLKTLLLLDGVLAMDMLSLQKAAFWAALWSKVNADTEVWILSKQLKIPLKNLKRYDTILAKQEAIENELMQYATNQPALWQPTFTALSADYERVFYLNLEPEAEKPDFNISDDFNYSILKKELLKKNKSNFYKKRFYLMRFSKRENGFFFYPPFVEMGNGNLKTLLEVVKWFEINI